LLAFAVEIAGEMTTSDMERTWVEKLRDFHKQAWPGINFDLDERFPQLEEKKFWAKVYHNVARRVFLRRLGNQEATCWQSSAIGDAYIIARLLTRAVQEVENAWHPKTEDNDEFEAFMSGRINIRV
jgi:hypothetical protein